MPITSRGLAALLLLTSALAGCEQPRFDPTSDARAEFEHALSRATAAKRYLMVVFGADWCTDCRKLYENLHTPDVRAYMSEHMDFMTVDVGRRERNLDLAAQLGVSIGNGIPVAVFFDPTGNPVGTTNDSLRGTSPAARFSASCKPWSPSGASPGPRPPIRNRRKEHETGHDAGLRGLHRHDHAAGAHG